MRPKDILLADETLFKDEQVFTPSYVPEDFIHRDDQIKEISLCLKPGLRGVNPVNTLVYGPPGTGKTTAIKYIFNEVNTVSSKLVTVYVNCDDYNTRFGIFSKIHETLFGHSPPDTGKPLNSVKEKIFKKLTKEDKSLVVALDEIDQLFINKTVEKLMLDLLKAHTTYGYDRIGIVGILIDDSIMSTLDTKISSIYNPQKVYFPPYNLSEVSDILGKRIRYGLYDGVLSDEDEQEIISMTSDCGDLRTGIDLIRRSALLAESDGCRKISKNHIKLAWERESKTSNIRRMIESLDDLERKLLSLIAENKDIASGSLHEKLHELEGTSVKKYNQMITKLEHIGLIETLPVPGRGQSRKILLKHPLDAIKKLI